MDALTLNSLGPPEGVARGQFVITARRLASGLAPGSDASSRVASGLEYAESRPYQAGDSVRRLDWRQTARRGHPYTRDYEALKRLPVFLVVDTSASMAAGSTRISKLDAGVWLATVLGLASLNRMSPVAVIDAGEGGFASKPSLRSSDLWLALGHLGSRVGGSGTDIAAALRRVQARAPSTSMVVVLSDFHDPLAIDAMSRCAVQHDTLALHLTDPAEASPIRAGFMPAREAETGVAFLARSGTVWTRNESIRAAFLRNGCDYLRIEPHRPFLAPLRAFLSSRTGFSRRAR